MTVALSLKDSFTEELYLSLHRNWQAHCWVLASGIENRSSGGRSPPPCSWLRGGSRCQPGHLEGEESSVSEFGPKVKCGNSLEVYVQDRINTYHASESICEQELHSTSLLPVS
jgi:hypothetical protein